MNAPSVDQLQWDTFRNESGVEIPAFAVVKWTNADRNNGVKQVVGSQFNGAGGTLINSPVKVPIGRHGELTGSWGAYALFDSEGGPNPATGEEWGPAAGSWAIVRGGSGYSIVGDVEVDKVRVSKVEAASSIVAQSLRVELRADKAVGDLSAQVWTLDNAGNRIAQATYDDPEGIFSGFGGDPNPALGRGSFGKATLVASSNGLEPSRMMITELGTYPRHVVCQPNVSDDTSTSADVKWQLLVPNGGGLDIDLVGTNVTLRRDAQMVSTLSDAVRYKALLVNPTTDPPTYEAVGVNQSAPSGTQYYRLTETLSPRVGLTLGTGQGILQSLTLGGAWTDNAVVAVQIQNNSLLEMRSGLVIPTSGVPDENNNIKRVFGYGDVGDLPGYNGAASDDHISVCGNGAVWAGKGAMTGWRYDSPNVQIEVCSAWTTVYIARRCS